MKLLEHAGGRRPGAYKLLSYIRANYRTIPAFCEAHSLDRVSVQRAIRGEIRRFEIELAGQIETATKGYVAKEEWMELDSESLAAEAAKIGAA